MKRREFLSASCAAGALSALSAPSLLAADGAHAAAERAWIEIRFFWTASVEKRDALAERIDATLIPTRNRLGLKPVGAFTLSGAHHADDKGLDPKFATAVFVVSSADSLETLTEAPSKIAAELAPDAFFNTDPNDPAYLDQSVTLLRAFPGFAKLAVPNLSSDRVLQMRFYHSMNYERNRAKIRMFDGRGELPLFIECGMNPVFFGETKFGEFMPNLTYMLSFENDDARKAGWDKFVRSDEWKQMSGEEEFKNTATRIRNLFLKPTKNSQI